MPPTTTTTTTTTTTLPAAAEAVLLSEISGGSPAYVELVNVGLQPVALGGWQLVATGCGSDVEVNHVLPAFILMPGVYVKVVEGGGANTADTIYLGTSICWNADEAGSAALISSSGTGRDFVRWGGSTASPVAPTTWDERFVVPAFTATTVLARGAPAKDTHSATDWCRQRASAPGRNRECGARLFIGEDEISWSLELLDRLLQRSF